MAAKMVKFDRKKIFSYFSENLYTRMRIGWRNMRAKFRNPLMSLELMRIFPERKSDLTWDFKGLNENGKIQ
jgi:hypothetical protein